MVPSCISCLHVKKLLDTPGGTGCGGETALEEIAAGGRVPIDHLSRAKKTGTALEHEMIVEFVPWNAASRGDGFLDGARAAQLNGEGLGESGQHFWRGGCRVSGQ